LPVSPLRLELGIWRGKYRGMELAWLRFWDDAGELLPTGDERADVAAREVERLAALVRELGGDPQSHG
jgi:hypothetical protein